MRLLSSQLHQGTSHDQWRVLSIMKVSQFSRSRNRGLNFSTALIHYKNDINVKARSMMSFERHDLIRYRFTGHVITFMRLKIISLLCTDSCEKILSQVLILSVDSCHENRQCFLGHSNCTVLFLHGFCLGWLCLHYQFNSTSCFLPFVNGPLRAQVVRFIHYILLHWPVDGNEYSICWLPTD